jgi:Interferon-induced transmembrane protein
MSYDAPPPPPPGYGYGQPTAPPPPNYLVWAILTTILCCLPAGIVSIVYAAQVNSKWAQGDVAGAQRASQNARTWAIVSVVAFFVLAIVYVLIAIAAANSSDASL